MLPDKFHPPRGQRRRHPDPAYIVIAAIILSTLIALDLTSATPTSSQPATQTVPNRTLYLPLIQRSGLPPIVFVSRQIPPNGTVYWSAPKSMPGVGPYSRFQIAAPGKLIVREADGQLRTLIDGANPTAASLNLIDVTAPDVSYDGTQIVFAGLPQGNYANLMGPLTNPGAWRIYAIHVNGTGLRQITTSDQNLNLSQFDFAAALRPYDDSDPVWLPDGRIAFASTRWPGFGMYGAARTSNIFVVNANGANLHRITSERNGADRLHVDPLTGMIVYSRWWRNFRFATDSMATVTNSNGGFDLNLGLVAANKLTSGNSVGAVYNLQRNAWHIATINPDGTGLRQWGGGSSTFLEGEDGNFAYGGNFAPDGTFYGNFFPMKNGTEAAGFGGIRRYTRGPNGYTGVIGILSELGYQLASTNPPSYGVFVGNYAADPAVLPDGRLIVSWATDINQDYGLYAINADGSNRQLLYDNVGTTELRTRVIQPRPLPPVIPAVITATASALPPTRSGPYNQDGTFVFNALNVYFNAPVDTNIINAIPVGSAGTIRFFADLQQHQSGSVEHLDWPILLAELPVAPDGSVVEPNAPANIPLFEQIRSPQPEYKVPRTGLKDDQFGGAAHVAGLNFGRPGAIATCVGCHSGHTMIPPPPNPADAKFTNLATGAVITFSSTHPNPFIDHTGKGLTDRRVLKGSFLDYWRSDPAQNRNQQWVQLTFPVPVTVRKVRLYNPRSDPELSIQVNATTVKLFSDAAATQQVASNTAGALAVSGTDVNFSDVKARAVRVELTNVTGLFQNEAVASLAEIEVIARGEAP